MAPPARTSNPVDTRETAGYGWARRASQEISFHAAELDSAMQRDDSVIVRHVYASQRTPRFIGVAVLTAVAAAANLSRLPILLGVVAVAAAYAGGVLLTGGVVTNAQRPPAVHRETMRRLLVGDAVVASVLLFLIGGDGVALIPIIGVLLVAMAAFYLGTRDAVVTLATTVGGYVVASVVWRLAFESRVPTWAALGFTAIVFALTGAGAIHLFGGFRRRLDALRMYCKLAEVGEAGVSIPIDAQRVPDDLTFLAGSFDAMRSRLADQVGSDPLTGCANRRILEQRLLADWRRARRQHTSVAVAALDIDHFKQINDTRGHPVGDLVLQQLASIMLGSARDTDTVARLGGDEFVIVLPDTEREGAVAFAERLRQSVMEFTFGASGAPLSITVSLGVAITAGSASIAPEDLMADADRCLYRAKTEGRNRVCV